MRDRLFALLGIESGEESMVSILLTQSVFLGIFFGAFDISAHSLFLSIFDEKMMARGYVVSGLAGIILTTLYTWLQTRMQFKNFAVINLIAVTLFTVALWLALTFFPSRGVIFIVFLMLGPLNILAMLGFWGTTGRLFTLRQGKRLFGLVDAGLIIGVIISCYTIPVLLTLKFGTHNILLVSASSVLVATVIQILIGARFRLVSGTSDQKKEKPAEKNSFFSVFREDRYIRIMGVFIALSVVTAFFVQYSFMAVTREQYPSEEDMARFLGIFTGSMMIFTLLVKLFVFSYLIRNYGLRTCLAVTPVLLAGFTVIAITIGMLAGYTPESINGFLIFFMLLALSRLFSKALKDSLESPSFKVIYQTIDEKVRYAVQSGMDGTVNEIAALSSGVLLAGLGVLSFIKLIHFSWVLLFIILLWLYFATRLYNEYRKSIRKALETVSPDIIEVTPGDDEIMFNNRFSAKRAIRTDYFRIISGDLSATEINPNKRYLREIINYSAAANDLNLVPVLKRVSANINLDEEIRRESAEAAGKIEKSASQVKARDDKIGNARKMLSGARKPQPTEILRLLRENSALSKRYAIYIIGKFRINDLLPEVCECLGMRGLESDAYSVLNSFGNEAVAELTRNYMVSSGNINTSKLILSLLGKTSSPESQAFLFSRLWSTSRQLKETTVQCLIDCDFKPSGEDKDRLHQMISDIIGLMTWNLSAKVCLEKCDDKYLLDVIEKEINRWNQFLFNLLSVTYDPGSINKIKENLEKDTVESVNYALEMIDIVIDDSVKPKLISLLDIVPAEAKLRNLYQFFPGEVPKYEKLQENIINRDYNLLSLWTKACTLRHIPEFADDDMAESGVALLFSPEPVLQEEAARLIVRSSRELYKTVSLRIPDSSRKRLDRIVYGESDEKELIWEKVSFLSGCIKGIPEDELLHLSGEMKFFRDSGEGNPLHDNNCIIWPLEGAYKGHASIFYYEGEEKNRERKQLSGDNVSYYSLSLDAVEDYLNHFPERAPKVLKYIDNIEE